MKISGYYKELGYNVQLISYQEINQFDKIFLSKVFDYTKIPINLKDYPQIKYGGTGFYYDQASPLPNEIEHHKPDYELYKDFVEKKIRHGDKRNKWKYYLDYSIGFTTRGCFRKCSFCVNKKYNKVHRHSLLNEFVDPTKKYICLLDDNILGYVKSQEILEELIDTGKYFEFKQGMDIRLMTEEKAKLLSKAKYKGDYIFAFDNIKDKNLIENKLKLWRSYNNKTTKLYILCAYDENNKYDLSFWIADIINTFERIKILIKYQCLPYIMRYKEYKNSPFYGMYINLARWCNQPDFFKKKTFREYCEVNGKKSSTMKYMEKFEYQYPEIAKKYFNIRFEDFKPLRSCYVS